MRTLLQRLNKIEARLADGGDCKCPPPPSPAPDPGMVIAERHVVSPPLRLLCPDCRKLRTVEFVAAVMMPQGNGASEQ